MTELIFILWGIGLVLSMCITLSFLIKRDLDEEYIGIAILLVLVPIINIVYPIYIGIKYFKVNYKDFL